MVVFESDRKLFQDRYQAYLGDESKLRADSASGIAFPISVDELAEVCARCSGKNQPMRVSGGRTGITGAAVPDREDVIISLDRMKGIGEGAIAAGADGAPGTATIRVAAGITLHELNEALAERHPDYFFPPDPTETWAALGGMAATNASGARSYAYGPMRSWVVGATVVLSDGTVLGLERGRHRYSGSEISIDPSAIISRPGGSLSGNERINERAGEGHAGKFTPLPRPKTKCTVGYYLEESGDLLDLFIGSEGTLGIFAELSLRLAPVPKDRLVYLQLFPSEESALTCVERIRACRDLRVLAIEYIDRFGLRFVRSSATGSKTMPARLLDEDTVAALAIEIDIPDDDHLALALTDLEGAVSDVGADSTKSFAGTSAREIREVKIFRHSVPEGINGVIAKRKERYPGLHKVGTDMAVPDEALHAIYRLYRETLEAEDLEYAIFGHAGNNHFHVNILPRDESELRRAKELYRTFARRVVDLGGAVAAEHGVGRLKRDLLLLQYTPAQLESMRRVRRFFDPRGLLNRGVLFDDLR